MEGNSLRLATSSDINVKNQVRPQKATALGAAQSSPVRPQGTGTWLTTNANLGGHQSQATEEPFSKRLYIQIWVDRSLHVPGGRMNFV